MKNRTNKDNHWITPASLYAELDEIYQFSIFDPCPPHHDLSLWDGTIIDWDKPGNGESIFINPPFDAKSKEAFVKNGLRQVKAGIIKTAVYLLPVSTSTKLFHDIIQAYATEIYFLKGRPLFEGVDSRGNHVNPGMGRYTPKHVPENAKRVFRSGQMDMMVVEISRP